MCDFFFKAKSENLSVFFLKYELTKSLSEERLCVLALKRKAQKETPPLAPKKSERRPSFRLSREHFFSSSSLFFVRVRFSFGARFFLGSPLAQRVKRDTKIGVVPKAEQNPKHSTHKKSVGQIPLEERDKGALRTGWSEKECFLLLLLPLAEGGGSSEDEGEEEEVVEAVRERNSDATRCRDSRRRGGLRGPRETRRQEEDDDDDDDTRERGQRGFRRREGREANGNGRRDGDFETKTREEEDDDDSDDDDSDDGGGIGNCRNT